jgi:hypothetical protein
MKHLFNNLSSEEKNRILEMYSSNSELINEQLGSGVAAAATGLGSRIKTIAQNVGRAVSPNKGQRVINSPKLAAALTRTKTRTNLIQKTMDDLDADLAKILQIVQTEKTGQFKTEAEQLETLLNGYRQTLANVKAYNTQLASAQLQAPTLQNTNQQPQTTTGAAETGGQTA